MAKNLSKFPFIFLFLVVVLAFCFPSIPKAVAIHTSINTADTAWMLTATALVLIMTPGLAFFYGGMVNKKNVISTMLQSFICMVLITVMWVVFGFSLAFGESIGGFIGNPSTYFMMNGVIDGQPWKLAPTIPFLLFAMYQLKFAIFFLFYLMVYHPDNQLIYLHINLHIHFPFLMKGKDLMFN